MNDDDTARRDATLADDLEAAAFASLYRAAPAALRARLGLAVEQRHGATLLLAPGLPSTMFNRVIGLGLHEPMSDGAPRLLCQRYAQAGVAPWWLHWNPLAAPEHGLRDLLAAGWRLPARRSWAKMLRDTAQIPRVESTLRAQIATPVQRPQVAAAIATSFGMPVFMAEWLDALAADPSWCAQVLLDGDAVAGGAYLFMQGDAGWLGMGAVLPAARGRRGQRLLIAERIAVARAEGCRVVATETGEPIGDEPNPSLHNLRASGFRQVASRWNLEPPVEAPLPEQTRP